jgi:hypothetical protein
LATINDSRVVNKIGVEWPTPAPFGRQIRRSVLHRRLFAASSSTATGFTANTFSPARLFGCNAGRMRPIGRRRIPDRKSSRPALLKQNGPNEFRSASRAVAQQTRDVRLLGFCQRLFCRHLFDGCILGRRIILRSFNLLHLLFDSSHFQFCLRWPCVSIISGRAVLIEYRVEQSRCR